MMRPVRISREDLEKRRAKKSTRIFLTGGTGFLGSHIAAELLRRGYRLLLLARPGRNQSAASRVAELLDWFGLTAGERLGLRVVEGDISRSGLGMEVAAYEQALRETDEVIHSASNTAFSERKRAEVEAVNAGGLARVLNFAGASQAHFFHHISTAFVAGKTSRNCPEDLVEAREFYNAYEETKCRGEHLAWEACRNAGLGLSIYRPSIVYGDSRTGRSLLFNAVYYPVRTALFIKNLFEKEIREGQGKRAEEMGVRIEADGSTRLPLRIEVADRGGLNLIPVDYFTSAFMALWEGAPDGGIFHIVNDKPKRIEDIIDYSSRLFRLTGIRACASEEFRANPKKALETLYDHSVEAYVPYMKDTRTFETKKSQPLLKARGLVCPEFDYDIFARCMTYAVEVAWGSRLFNSATRDS
jgi:nucleoside-diphosphate-sugar epimerase